MPKNLLEKVSLTEKSNLLTMVEHRQKFDLDNVQLNIFETHQKADRVKLSFDDLVITSMLRGKKIMHLNNKESFDYLPGESVIVPGDEVMEIDFPEANEGNPTQCLALVISKDQISNTLEMLNNRYPKVADAEQWCINDTYFHLPNNRLLADALNQLVKVSLYDHTIEKGILASLKVEEILIRIMQTQARILLEYEYKNLSNNPFATVVEYIKHHLASEISMTQLSKKAYMSKATFYRKFVQEFGITPQAFIQRERIKKAKKLLGNINTTIMEVAFHVGFNNPGHFSTFFKNMTGFTPKEFQVKKM